MIDQGGLFPLLTSNYVLKSALKATSDYPSSNNPGDYDLGIVGFDIGTAYQKTPSDISATIFQELSGSFAQANTTNGRGTNLP